MQKEQMQREADVLVIGGGPAGTWAAYTAAIAGANVILVDKGYCGSSGATAPSGTNLWDVHTGATQKEKAIHAYLVRGNGLSNRQWLEQLIEETDAGTKNLIQLGYAFPLDEQGNPVRRSLQGPEYMRLMRRTILKAGVKILDHAPVLQLLTHDTGVVGARGIRVQSGEKWRVHAKAVVLATGGCAFLSKALGCNVLTGDGYLLAAEAGAELSGMEFSNEYGLSAAFSTVTKNFFFQWATFTEANGRIILQRDKRTLAKYLMKGPVYAKLDKAMTGTQADMRLTQPNFFLPFDRMGINPFQHRFPIALRLEGTVRGNGGINLVDATCATSLPGLFAAGDAATREFVAGGTTGGGSINASWAMTSGRIAGTAAACFARTRDQSSASSTPQQQRTQTTYTATEADLLRVLQTLQQEVIPFEKNLFRSEATLQQSMRVLKRLWQEVNTYAVQPDNPRHIVRLRELSAMIATARWMYTSALARRESRGMHQLAEHPQEAHKPAYRLIIQGVEPIQVTPTEKIPEAGGIRI